MLRKLLSVASLCVLLSSALPAAAQSSTLLAASDPSQISALDLAKVVAPDGSAWLSVRLKGRTRLAVVTSQSARELAPNAPDWLRALDFVTRVRVAPPSGTPPSCGEASAFPLADSGLPEQALLLATQSASVDSEIELRRELSDAGMTVGVDSIARFVAAAAAPFQLSFYQGASDGGSTAALRLIEQGPGEALPQVIVAGLDSLPSTLIALADRAVLPVGDDLALPSDFAVSYRGGSRSTDYGEARSRWLTENPKQWLSEAQGTHALFDWTAFPNQETLVPAITRYFQGMPFARARACQSRIEAARNRGSLERADYVCEGADDLAVSLAQLGFREPRLSRLFAALPGAGAPLRVESRAPRDPRIEATDFDTSGCPMTAPVPGGMSTPPPVFTPAEPAPSSSEPGPYYEPTTGEPVYVSDGSSCNVVFVSDDSCSGDTSAPPPSSSDSCSGDTTTEDSSDSCSGDSSGDDGPDSCSGDSSSSDGGDSCSGDSDSSSDDSSGCGKSEYDGDTCSGDTKGEAHAALGPSKPRRVRLSLVTLLLAAFALPLRRRTGFR